MNPKDGHDDDIMIHFDDLVAGKKSDVDLFTSRIALLLKHDWETVKWDSTPIYFKPLIRFSSKQWKWRRDDYRKVEVSPTHPLNC
jgi:hypothetical protein